MKSKKFFLKNIDDETAELLDKEYPTELTPDDIDDIFRKSYKKFMKADVSDTEKQPETVVVSVPVEIIQSKRRFAFFSLNKICAVICGIIVITGFYALLKTPVSDIETPDDINKLPVVTDNNNNTSTTFNLSATTEKTTTKTNSTSTTTSTATEIITTTSAESAVIEPVIINNEQIEETTEIQAEITEIQVETTETQTEETQAETTVTTVTLTQTTVTTELSLTTEPVTTDRKDNPWGYFKIVDLYGANYCNIYYERTNTEPVNMIEHTPNVDYYSLEIFSEYSDASKVWYLKTKEDGKPIVFQELSYYYFLKQISVSSEITFIEINDKPAIFAESNSSYCLIWDDGCHVCSITAVDPDDYDFIFEFAENYK